MMENAPAENATSAWTNIIDLHRKALRQENVADRAFAPINSASVKPALFPPRQLRTWAHAAFKMRRIINA
jgi:hypothetical protein